VINHLRQADRPVFVVILKGRQMGVSTLCEGLEYWRTGFFRRGKGLVMAHEDASVKNLYSMFKLYHESVPEVLAPMLSHCNTEGIGFDNPDVRKRATDPGLGSEVIVRTAALGGGSKANAGKGRGQTNHITHLSEAAFYAEPERLWGGMKSSIHARPGVFCLIESTANGHGNWYHGMWQNAAAGWDMRRDPTTGAYTWTCVDPSASRSSFYPMFLSWLEHPDYRLTFDGAASDRERAYYDKHLDEEERKIADLYGGTLEQIEWRRRQIADFGGDTSKFHVEYPTSPDEAFVSSGRRVFDAAALERLERKAKERDADPPRFEVWVDRQGEVQFQQSRQGPVSFFRDPVPGKRYAVGVDLCYGKTHGDFACAQVVSEDWEQVAVAHGRIEPGDFAMIVWALCLLYNQAMAVVEANNGPGLHCDKKLGEYGYWNRYLRVSVDRIDQKRQQTWGWTTSQKTKALVVETLKAGTRDGEITIHDLPTIQEFREWVLVTGSTGKTVERPADPLRGYDDRVMAFGIGLVGGIIQQGVGGDAAAVDVAPVVPPKPDVPAPMRNIVSHDQAVFWREIAEMTAGGGEHDILGDQY
jgi:hypothetical protein